MFVGNTDARYFSFPAFYIRCIILLPAPLHCIRNPLIWDMSSIRKREAIFMVQRGRVCTLVYCSLLIHQEILYSGDVLVCFICSCVAIDIFIYYTVPTVSFIMVFRYLTYVLWIYREMMSVPAVLHWKQLRAHGFCIPTVLALCSVKCIVFLTIVHFYWLVHSAL